MPQQTINIGSAPNDGTGDDLRTAGDKINDNFTELYAGAGGGTLDDLSDVDAYEPADGDILIWDASAEAWINSAGGGGGSGVTVEEDGASEGTGILTLNFTTGLDVSVTGTEATISATPLPVVATDADDYTVLAADVNKYIRLTGAGTKDIIVQDEATEALPANGEWHFRNAGAGDATFDDTDVTINAPAGGTLVVPEGGTVTLKRVAVDEFDLFGVTVPA